MKKIELESFNEIFGDEEMLKDEKTSINVPIDKLVPYDNHPFKLYTGNRLEDMMTSIKEMGVIVPIVVRKLNEGNLEILSGHNRVNAAKNVGLKRIPAIIKEGLSEDEALLIVTETNLVQRSFSDLLPSEKAKSLKVHYDALKRQGLRNDLVKEIKEMLNDSNKMSDATCTQIGYKLKSIQVLGAEYGLSKNSVARYIRLNYLTEDLLDMLDEGNLAFIPAVNISYMTKEDQILIYDVIEKGNYSVNVKDSRMLKELSKDKKLNKNIIHMVLSGTKKEEKKKRLKVVLDEEFLAMYFDKDYGKEEIRAIIHKALTEYFNKGKSD